MAEVTLPPEEGDLRDGNLSFFVVTYVALIANVAQKKGSKNTGKINKLVNLDHFQEL